MKNKTLLSDDFCAIPSFKVFLLGIATFGLYLVYWYEIQYAHSKKIPRSAFKDFLKSYFFIFCSFKLAEKINQLFEHHKVGAWLSQHSVLLFKGIIVVSSELLFFKLYGVHVFLFTALVLESGYATLLQTVINRHAKSDTKHLPWQQFDLFHWVVFVGGFTLLVYLQCAEDPLSLFIKHH